MTGDNVDDNVNLNLNANDNFNFNDNDNVNLNDNERRRTKNWRRVKRTRIIQIERMELRKRKCYEGMQ